MAPPIDPSLSKAMRPQPGAGETQKTESLTDKDLLVARESEAIKARLDTLEYRPDFASHAYPDSPLEAAFVPKRYGAGLSPGQRAQSILDRVHIRPDDMGLWGMFMQLLRELVTLGQAETLLFDEEAIFDRLVVEVSKLPPDSPVIPALIVRLPWRISDDFITHVHHKNSELLASLSIEGRRAALRAVREGWITEEEAALFNGLVADFRADDFARGQGLLSNSQTRAHLRAEYAELLAPKDGAQGRRIRFRDSDITVSKARGDEDATVVLDIAYASSQAILNDASRPEFLAKVLYESGGQIGAEATKAKPPVIGADGEPVHFQTVVFRPGLANVGPSAAHLFRLAQHADHVVLAHPIDDGRPEHALRPLTHYRGAKVPPELEGKLFVMGSEAMVLQDLKTGAGVLIDQLESLENNRFGIHTEEITTIGHSQGTAEITLAQEVLAAHGYPDVIKRNISLAPTNRGALVVDDTLVPWLGQVGGGDHGYGAVKALDPDNVASLIPEWARESTDLTYLGHVSKSIRPEHWSLPMVLTESWSQEGLEGGEGDGLVDARSTSFVADQENGRVVASTALDHLAIIAESPDEYLGHVGSLTPRPNLRLLAQP